MDNIQKAHHIVYENQQRSELVLAIMRSTSTRSDDITLGEAFAILVAYYVNKSTGGLDGAQKEEVLATVIMTEFYCETGGEMSTERSQELAKRCDALFADILKKQAGLT